MITCLTDIRMEKPTLPPPTSITHQFITIAFDRLCHISEFCIHTLLRKLSNNVFVSGSLKTVLL